MSYQTYHEALDENQAEQEGITMGELLRQISSEELEDYERLKALELEWGNTKVAPSELDVVINIRHGKQIAIDKEEYDLFSKVRNFVNDKQVKLGDLNLELLNDIRDGKKAVLDLNGEGNFIVDDLSKLFFEDVTIDELDALSASLSRAIKNPVHIVCGEYEPPVAETGDDRFTNYQIDQTAWSLRTFGPGPRTAGILDHIRKELAEIEKSPYDLLEWIDVVILALDGYWRHGGNVRMVIELLLRKQVKNFARKWPDWRTMSEDVAIEHDRSDEK